METALGKDLKFMDIWCIRREFCYRIVNPLYSLRPAKHNAIEINIFHLDGPQLLDRRISTKLD